jgi:hypothetical protein
MHGAQEKALVLIPGLFLCYVGMLFKGIVLAGQTLVEVERA